VNFFDRISEPILIQHGLADRTCPVAWTTKTLAALRKAGRNASLYTYPHEDHAFAAAWPTSMARTVAFLKQHGL
jgi:dipeptidyl aminopeptidase/acylaminoacyl peptidase